MKSATPDPCEALAWDTDFWGFKIAKVRGNTLTREAVQSLNEWCRTNQVRCLYFLSRPDDIVTARLAGVAGFSLVDIRVTLERQARLGRKIQYLTRGSAAKVRPSRPADTSRLEDVARLAFRDTRFYFDTGFPREMCQSLYSVWTRLDCEGRSDIVFVAELGTEPIGYISCQLEDEDRIGRISLLAVSPIAHGQGVGQKLVHEALDWFEANDADRVSVVTQGRNLGAQRLYQQCGFLPQSMQLWYHKWYW